MTPASHTSHLTPPTHCFSMQPENSYFSRDSPENSYLSGNPAGNKNVMLGTPIMTSHFSGQALGPGETLLSYQDLFSGDITGRIIPFPSVPSISPFDMAGVSSLEIMDVRAQIASRNHKEAERRRRERINSHFSTLRTLLPCTSKRDKASLLAEVIQQVKDLKRQTSEIEDGDLFPTETDEVTVFSGKTSGDGKTVIKATFCCDDRSDLLPELIKTLKSLRLRTLKAEITTLGGRVRNMLVVTGEEEEEDSGDPKAGFLQDALKAVVQRSGNSSGRIKRQRTVDCRSGL